MALGCTSLPALTLLAMQSCIPELIRIAAIPAFCCPEQPSPPKKKRAPRGAPFRLCGLKRSDRIVHVELDRVRRHFITHHFLHLQFDIGVDEVVVEDATGLEEAAILVEALESFAQ